jgi:hypothetical protein
VECCWIQTISDRKYQKLKLAAERGFSPEIRQEIGTMDMSHSFSEQIIGRGQKIVIPDLSNDGLYGLPSFRATGFRWLVAVPLMTYRVHGILGIASRNRKLLQKHTAELTMVIAGMIAASLSKAQLSHQLPEVEKPAGQPSLEIKGELQSTVENTVNEPALEIESKLPVETAVSSSPALEFKEGLTIAGENPAGEPALEVKEEPPMTREKPETRVNIAAPANPPIQKPVAVPDIAFHVHARKMQMFRKSHP